MSNTLTPLRRSFQTKKKLPITVRFSLRPGYTTVQIRISVNGDEGSPFATLPNQMILDVDGLAWNQKLQKVNGSSEVDRRFNLELERAKDQIKAVYDRQLSVGIIPTAKSVKCEYQTGTPFVASRPPIDIKLFHRNGCSTLEVRISINGEQGPAFSMLRNGRTLSMIGARWSQEKQRAIYASNSPVARQFNAAVEEVKVLIKAAYDRQLEAGLTPTPMSVRDEYQTGTQWSGVAAPEESMWSAVNCYQTYLTELRNGGFPEKKLVKSTLEKWGYGLDYIYNYVTQTKGVNAMSIGSADKLTLFWGKSYHRWLMSDGPMSADSATRYVNRLIEAINYVTEMGAIEANPLANLKLPRGKTKDVYFLEPPHLDLFWRLNLSGKLKIAHWWMGIIFLTGLDYPDAVRYVANRKAYDRTDSAGNRKIVIRRAKPPQAECHIPILPELESLLQVIPEGPAPTQDTINKSMRTIAELIGFERALTCKIGRKTAGAIFFGIYGDINAVSRMMGHSSVSITERYYVKTTGYTVDRAMSRRQESQLVPRNAFIQLQLAS